MKQSRFAGRVKRCSSKQVELLCIGVLRVETGWHNNGYIFPDGFCTRTVFRSSVRTPKPAFTRSPNHALKDLFVTRGHLPVCTFVITLPLSCWLGCNASILVVAGGAGPAVHAHVQHLGGGGPALAGAHFPHRGSGPP